MSNTTITNQQVYDLDRQYVFHSWSVQNNLNPLVIKSSQGCKLWDYAGKEYLDFSSQLVNTNIGHQHPKVIAAIKEQAEQLTTIAPQHAVLIRGLAAKAILNHAPADFTKIFFTNAGADANENAIRMARLYTGKSKVLSAYRSYHGNTGAAINATGDWRRIPNEYATGHVHFFTPYLYRSDFNAHNQTEETTLALQHLRRVIESEGAQSIACIILETIPGTAGIFTYSKEYLRGVRELANEFNIVLILDEVMAGFGRTGHWFAADYYQVTPDLITFAKGVNSGYVPVGGVIIHEKINTFLADKMFPGGLTYSGHPLAMASIVANIAVMEEEKVVENAAFIGNILKEKLTKLAQKHPIIGEVRGLGVFWAIELVTDKISKQPLSLAKMNQLKALCLEKGLLAFIAENRIHVVPPCTVSPAEVDQAIAIYDAALSLIAA